LGPETFGELSYVLAFVAFFQVFSTLGLDGLAVRDIAQNQSAAGAILGTVLRLRLAAAVASFAMACLLIQVLRPGDSGALLLVGIVATGMLFQTADVIDLWFQGQSQNRRATVARATSYFASNGTKVVLILTKAPLWAFAAAQVLELALVSLFLFLAYRAFRAKGPWQWDKSIAKSLVHQSWPLLLSGLSIIVYLRIDQVMLRELAGERELGIYSAALPFSQALSIIPVAVCASLLPTLSRNYSDDPALFWSRLQKLFTVLAWASILLVAALYLSARWLVATLLGDAYAPSAEVLSVLALTNIFIFLGVVQTQWILIERRTGLAFSRTALGATVSVISNSFLIPLYGAQGAAYSALLAQFIAAFACNIFLAPQILRMQTRALFGLGLVGQTVNVTR
jgi:PST family polysaccharide transporter